MKFKFGYNDTAHFSNEKYNRNYWFKKVKDVWTAMRKYSKIRGKTKYMFETLRKEVSQYDRPSSIILRVEKSQLNRFSKTILSEADVFP